MTTLRILIWFAVAAAVMLGAVWLAERPGTSPPSGAAGGSIPPSASCWSHPRC